MFPRKRKREGRQGFPPETETTLLHGPMAIRPGISLLMSDLRDKLVPHPHTKPRSKVFHLAPTVATPSLPREIPLLDSWPCLGLCGLGIRRPKLLTLTL